MPIIMFGGVTAQLRVALGLFLFLLGGCAGQLNTHQAIDEKTILKADQGIVVARVINLSAYPLPFNQLTIIPEHLNQSKAIRPERLLAAQKVLDGSTVFASALKAGNYSLSSVGAYHTQGDFFYQFWIPAEISFGTFEVRSSQIIDLGTVIYYPKIQGENYLKVLAKVPDTNKGEVLDSYFPFREYDKANLLTWKVDGYEQDRYEEYLSILQNPVTFSKPYMTPSGSMLFMSELGAILERSAQGDWQLDVVDTNLTLNSVQENHRGDRIVGGSEGRVFRKPVGGKWQDLSLDPRYHIDEVLFAGDNAIDILAREDFKLTVFRADLSSRDIHWQELNSFQTATGWQFLSNESEKKAPKKPPTPRRMSGATLITLQGESFVSVYTQPKSANPVFASHKTHIFTYDPATWIATPAKKAWEFDVTLEAGAVDIGVKRPSFWSLSNKTQYFRQDKTTDQWHQIKPRVWRCREGEPSVNGRCKNPKKPARWLPFTLKSIPWFSSETHGIAIGTGINGPWKDISGEDEGPRILRTTDGGKTWRFTDKVLPREYCTNFINHFEDRVLLGCNGLSGDFYESVDSGDTWQQVREQEDF